MTREIIDYFVLDSLADDIESLGQIVSSVRDSANFWDVPNPSSFDRQLVVLSLQRLVRDEKVAVLVYDSNGKELVDAGEGIIPDGSMEDFWFNLTPTGRIVHTAWNPPPERTPA